MNKLIVLLIAFISIVGIVLSSSPYSVPLADAKTPVINKKLTGKFWDLTNTGKDMQCTYSTKQQKTISNGVIYVSGANLRGNFTTTIAKQTIKTYMIKKGDIIYTWTSAANIGTKMTYKAATNPTSMPSQEKMDNFNQKYNYTCTSWTPDTTLFTPPSNINFIDASNAMQGIRPSIKMGNACSACDSIPNATAKASCKQKLGC